MNEKNERFSQLENDRIEKFEKVIAIWELKN